MKKIPFFLFFILPFFVTGQEMLQVDEVEQLAINSEVVSEDDWFLQHASYYKEHPINLNEVKEEELKAFSFLTAMQVSRFFQYRKLAGSLLSIYEMQAIPFWNAETIQQILPFVYVGKQGQSLEKIAERFQRGDYSFLSRIRWQQEQKTEGTSESVYPGSSEQVFTRLQYRKGNLLQWGFTAEKDAGEQWFKASQRKGFDFYSAHLFLRNCGLIQKLAIGDYTLNIGQGLIHWQNMAFRKSAEVLQLKRQAEVLRPYTSAGEVFFQRGVAATIGKHSWALTGFVSSKKMDGLVQVDSTQESRFITSWKTDGLHRSEREQLQKNTWRLISYGMTFRLGNASRHLSANLLHYDMNVSMRKPDVPYHLFSFRGNRLRAYSIDGGISLRNVHLFGEAAMQSQKSHAILLGMLASIDSRFACSILWRNLSPSFHSFFGNAFTEAAMPSNEKGVFTGVSIRPTVKWKLDAYMDLYRFPWLRFQKDAPTEGADYLLQVTYRWKRGVEMFSRFRVETGEMNQLGESTSYSSFPMRLIRRQNWRTQIQVNMNSSWLWRFRTEWSWVYAENQNPEIGFLTFLDVQYHPLMKPFSAGLRWQFFETDSYDSRIYAYENDVLFRFSIPSFVGKGQRAYLNIRYDISRNWSFWLRVASTFQRDPNAVTMNRISRSDDFCFQTILRFK